MSPTGPQEPPPPRRVGIRVAEDGGGPAGSDDEALPSLYRWLYEDESLLRTAEVTLRPAGPDGESMGGAWEAVNVALANAVALANLALAVAAWRRNQPSPPVVELEADGVKVKLSDDSPEAVARLAAALRPALQPPAPGPPAPRSPGEPPGGPPERAPASASEE